MILRLSKNGYGSIKELMELPSEWVLAALDYDNFVNDLEVAFIKLNEDVK